MAKRPTTHRAASDRAERRANVKRAWVIFGTLGVATLGLFLLTSGILSRRPIAVEEDHPHAAAVHGGTLISVGDDRDHYHVEVVRMRSGLMRLYTFAHDPTQVVEVDRQLPIAHLQAAGEAESIAVKFWATPQADDAVGKTSQFVCWLPWRLRGRPLTVTVPELVFSGRRFPVSITFDGSTTTTTMPVHVENADEVLRTPGGKYTAEDVKANGNTTAFEKFKKHKPRHDVLPKPGEAICPVTLSRANPEFAWIVGGERYRFCCPPCIDEFVLLARELPEEIASPETYIQK